jgi:hypothetical protein
MANMDVTERYFSETVSFPTLPLLGRLNQQSTSGVYFKLFEIFLARLHSAPTALMALKEKLPIVKLAISIISLWL